MKFCTECDNMYYVRISPTDDNKLSYFCRHCGHVDADLDNEGVCVLKTEMKKGIQSFQHMVNPYTKLDPTLPRVHNIACPNGQCDSNKQASSVPSEVIYLRYDDDNMKYIYVCTVCDSTWKT